MDVGAQGFKVPAGAPHCCRFHVRRMQFHPREALNDCCSHGPGSAAEVNHQRTFRQRMVLQHGNGLIDQQLCAAPGHEDAGLNQNTQAGKLRPPQDVLQRNTLHPAPDSAGKFRGTRPFRQQEPGFLFGEYTTRRPQQGDDLPEVQRREPAVDTGQSSWRRTSAPRVADGHLHPG